MKAPRTTLPAPYFGGISPEFDARRAIIEPNLLIHALDSAAAHPEFSDALRARLAHLAGRGLDSDDLQSRVLEGFKRTHADLNRALSERDAAIEALREQVQSIQVRGNGLGGAVQVAQGDYLSQLARALRDRGIKQGSSATDRVRLVVVSLARATAAAPGPLAINSTGVPIAEVIQGRIYFDDPDLILDSINSINIDNTGQALSLFGGTTVMGAAMYRYQQANGGGFNANLNGFPVFGRLTTFSANVTANAAGDVSAMFIGAIRGSQAGYPVAEYDPAAECACRF